MTKKTLVGLPILILLAVTGVFVRYTYGGTDDRATVQHAPASTGTIVQAVRAVGTLQAVRTIRVGSQVSGTVKAIYADFNSVVKKDQIIAEIDPSLLEVQVAVQTANIARQDNDLAQQRVQLANDQKNLERMQAQFEKGLVSPQQIEASRLQVKTRQSQIASAERMKVQSEAQLTQARLSVSFCTIRSPIEGVVVSRFVDGGQTVQASLNAPLLFTIATDLTTLRLAAGVDEADIGRIRRGMPVSFTVDSYRGQTFHGVVDAVRLNAQNQNSVVTYPVWIVVPNDDLRLRPSMTANLQIVVDTAADVVRVPNDALRFRPTAGIYTWLHAAPAPAQPGGFRLAASETPVEPPGTSASKVQQSEGDKIDDLFAQAPRRTATGQVWVYEETSADPTRLLRQILVRTGLSDPEFTEIISGDVPAGLEVVTGVIPPQSAFRQLRGGIFQQPQRGGGGMTPAGPAPLPTLNQPRGAPRGRG